MIYTVTFNTALDYILSVDGFTPGHSYKAGWGKINPGGKGVNVSIVLKNLDCGSTALGFVSGFSGEELVRLLHTQGIFSDFVRAKNGMTRINVKLLSEMETEISGCSFDITQADRKKFYKKLDKLKDGDTIVLAGSVPDCMPDTAYMEVLEYLKDKNLDIVVDAKKDLLRNILSYRPFLIKPNHLELGELFGVKISTKEEALVYAKRLVKLGARNVLISMAKQGAVFVSEDGLIYTAETPKGILRNSVGAGDSMIAGFLYGYYETGDYLHAFRMGVAAGSASAFSDELASRKEVLKLYKDVVCKINFTLLI